ncbi:MAG: RNA recognition motif domain-containing protein [Bacteroidota bacterium]
MNLFVGNISKTANDDAVRALFSEFGEVASVKLLTDKYTGESRGFAFVDMNNDAQAQTAMQKLSNAEFFGRRLVVSKARPKTTTYTPY